MAAPSDAPEPRRGAIQKRIQTPTPLSELVEVLPTGHDPSGVTHAVSYYLVHNIRALGFMPLTFVSLFYYTKKTLAAIAVYYTMRRFDWWKTLVHSFAKYGSSRRVKMYRAQRQPCDPKKQYFVTHHPHGLLVCPMFNWLAREEGPSATDRDDRGFGTKCRYYDGIRVTLCVAPAVQFYPLHGEIYRTHCTDASSSTIRAILKRSKGKTIKDTPMLSPGGFSEACYVDYSDKYEVSYIKGRVGFIKMAIEAGADILPTYSFGGQDMYRSFAWKRAWRAKKAQELGCPMFLWWGVWGTNIPYFEDTVNVSFDSFPASQYTLDEVEECHKDYMTYLKACFDEYKVLCEKTKNKEMIFCSRSEPAPDLPPPWMGKPHVA